MAIDAFLTFIGSAQTANGNISVSGETQDPSHPGAIELSAYDFGIENSVTIGSGSGGAGAGKARFSPFKFLKTVDKASPLLLLLVGEGGNFSKVTLALRKSGAKTDYVVYTFGTVYVSSQETSGSVGDDSPTETIQLAFGSLNVQYTIMDATGQPSGIAKGSWNQITNTP